jgi:hypothetical protein
MQLLNILTEHGNTIPFAFERKAIQMYLDWPFGLPAPYIETPVHETL